MATFILVLGLSLLMQVVNCPAVFIGMGLSRLTGNNIPINVCIGLSIGNFTRVADNFIFHGRETGNYMPALFLALLGFLWTVLLAAGVEEFLDRNCAEED